MSSTPVSDTPIDEGLPEDQQPEPPFSPPEDQLDKQYHDHPHTDTSIDPVEEYNAGRAGAASGEPSATILSDTDRPIG